MQSETSRIRSEVVQYCVGRGIDLGFGGDKVVPAALGFDRPNQYTIVGHDKAAVHGDARRLSEFRDGAFDYVYSSHLLEDFQDTEEVLDAWLRVLRVGGKLILYLPNEKRYRAHCDETGQPCNRGHKVEEMSLGYILDILARKPVSIIRTIEAHATYSFLVVGEKEA